VLPYKNALTSGAALLALSFGVPVIAPATEAFEGLVEDGSTGLLYSADNPEALTRALARATEINYKKRAMLRANAFRTASRLLWSDSRLGFFQLLNRLDPA